jgi:CHC2 zinc finger
VSDGVTPGSVGGLYEQLACERAGRTRVVLAQEVSVERLFATSATALVLPTEPAPPDTQSRRLRSVFSDPLETIPRPVYVEQLTGQRVDRSGKIRCPFHEDRTPSMHVYDDPKQGWYCFGCGRGGSIYDLAGLLWRRDTRGEDFLELRRELRASLA